MSPVSPTTTSIPPGGHPSQEDQRLPPSPPKSPEDLNGLPARQLNKILHQIQQRASPTTSSELSFPLASFFEQSVYSPTSSNTAPLSPSTSETVRVKSEICSPPVSLRPSPSPPDNEDQTLQPPLAFAASSRVFATSSHETSQDSLLNRIGESPSSPTARALRSLGLTRADLAQHAQRMKSFLGAGGRRGFPTAADLASVDVKSEATDSEMLLSLSSASSMRRQASVVSYTSSVCTTTTATDMSRASSSYPTGPSTNTSFDTTPSRERRAPRGRTVLPPLPPSSPPPMLSPVRSGESNRTGINSSPIRSPLASPAEAGPSRKYEPGEYTGGSDTPYVLPPGPRTSEKPSASYAALIGQAIMSANPGSDGRKKLTLAHIYAWISAAWPFYKPGEAGWMNSIRHNLSLNDCFVKIKRDGREKGKGSFWSIRQGDEDMFANGGFVRRNSNAKKRKKETTPANDASELQPADPPKRHKSNPATGSGAAYVYEPPQYPPLPGTSRSSAAASTSGASASQPPAKRTRGAPPAAPVNKKYYRSPLGHHMPSSSPARHESGRQERRREAEDAASKLTPSVASSPPLEDSSVSSSPPPVLRPATQQAEAPTEYPTKSGLMDMVINNSAKKRRVSGGATGPARVGALGNGSPVMKRRPNGVEEEPKTIYPASMLSRPRSPTQHINPRATLKTRSDLPARGVEIKPIHNTRTDDLGASSRQAPGPITPPSHTTPERSGSDRPGHFVAFKPSDIIPSTPPRTLAPLTMATSAERTPLSHAALHMSPSRPSDLSHFKNSVHPPSASYRDSSGLPMEFRTPMGRDIRRVPSLSGVMLAMPTDSPLRTPLGYGGARDINDLNSGCAEELMTSPTRRLTVTGPGDEQSPSMLFGGMYRSPDGTWGPPPSLNW